MHVISSEKILEKTDALHALNDAETNQLVRRFERKQPGIFVYLAGFSEREELNEEEQDHLFTLAIISWEVISDTLQRRRKIRISRLQELDEKTEQLFHEFSDAGEPSLQVYGKKLAEDHREPKLIEFLLNRVISAEIRQELKELTFVALVTVVDALLNGG